MLSRSWRLSSISQRWSSVAAQVITIMSTTPSAPSAPSPRQPWSPKPLRSSLPMCLPCLQSVRPFPLLLPFHYPFYSYPYLLPSPLTLRLQHTTLAPFNHPFTLFLQVRIIYPPYYSFFICVKAVFLFFLPLLFFPSSSHIGILEMVTTLADSHQPRVQWLERLFQSTIWDMHEPTWSMLTCLWER